MSQYGSPPPGGFGYPPNSPFGAPQPSGIGQLAVLNERSFIKDLLLTLVTCGIYGFYAFYVTEEELAKASGDPSINGAKDLLLTLVTCGIWGIYCYWRNAKKYHELATRYGLQRQDQSTIVLITMALGVGFIGWYLLQEEHNVLAAAGRGQR
jgi:hypothetical protein